MVSQLGADMEKCGRTAILPSVLRTIQCHRNRAQNSADLCKYILINYEEMIDLLASTDAINLSVLFFYLLHVDSI